MKNHDGELSVDEVVNNIAKVHILFFLKIYLLFFILDKRSSGWNTTLHARYVLDFFQLNFKNDFFSIKYFYATGVLYIPCYSLVFFDGFFFFLCGFVIIIILNFCCVSCSYCWLVLFCSSDFFVSFLNI